MLPGGYEACARAERGLRAAAVACICLRAYVWEYLSVAIMARDDECSSIVIGRPFDRSVRRPLNNDFAKSPRQR